MPIGKSAALQAGIKVVFFHPARRGGYENSAFQAAQLLIRIRSKNFAETFYPKFRIRRNKKLQIAEIHLFTFIFF
jgi:hypothetical protein